MPHSFLALLTRVVGCPLLCFILIVISSNNPPPSKSFFYVSLQACLCACLFACMNQQQQQRKLKDVVLPLNELNLDPLRSQMDITACMQHALSFKSTSSLFLFLLSLLPYFFSPLCHLFPVVLVYAHRWFGHLLLLFCIPRRADKRQ